MASIPAAFHSAARGDEPTRLAVGPLKLDVSTSRTATLFHVVDQISAWSQFCHGQYRRQMAELSEEDLAILAKHTDIRRRRGWGGGLEQTFYTTLGVDAAIEAGVAAGHLTPDEGRMEREVLTHFAERIDALIARERKHVDAFRARLADELPHLTKLAERLQAFFGTTPPPLPVFLIVNPDDADFGGGFNGHRLTLEVPRTADAYPTFVHEILHAFVDTRRAEVERAIAGVAGLDYQTMNEGIAHALAPGIVRPSGSDDALLDRVAMHLQRGQHFDQTFARFNQFGLALRPVLQDALDDPLSRLDTFLPRAVDVWRAVRELDAAVRRGAEGRGAAE
ncbi:MAG: hypothetical protein C4547_12365 [Phycisphaerales bacterium]|nr:MAG: hypothetical protein C4547_12365 [Phycisphaerales bacterium]